MLRDLELTLEELIIILPNYTDILVSRDTVFLKIVKRDFVRELKNGKVVGIKGFDTGHGSLYIYRFTLDK